MPNNRTWISAKRLKEAMEFWEMTAEELALETGFDISVINDALAGKYETEYIKSSDRYRIAKALTISMSALSDQPEPDFSGPGKVLVCSRGKDGPSCEIMTGDQFNAMTGRKRDGQL